LHADDIKLYSSYDTKASQAELSVAVDKLYQWSVTWQLLIASDKYFLCRISNTHNNCSHANHVNGFALPLVRFYIICFVYNVKSFECYRQCHEYHLPAQLVSLVAGDTCMAQTHVVRVSLQKFYQQIDQKYDA